jgi:hypothetical protein
MPMHKKTAKRAFLAAAALASVGCSQSLDRPQALELLRSSPNTPKAYYQTFLGGFLGGVDRDNPLEKILRAAGYLHCSDTDCNLTAKGLAQNWTHDAGPFYYVPEQTIVVDSITGISAGDPDHAVVTFAAHYAPTAIGAAAGMQREDATGTAVFSRFDDGWRVGAVSGIENGVKE